MLMISLAKRRDIPIIFALHNCLYEDPGNFEHADYVTVPSEFCRRHYWDKLGLASVKLPNVIDFDRVRVDDWQPCYVTYINPDLNKGVLVFARIAEVLAQRRPDISLLVVESRGQMDFLAEHGLDLRGLPNIRWMGATPDPREFYRVTKLLLMPSLWDEAFGLVAVEGMFNGIPVLGSNRGGIPEAIGTGGQIIEIPACYTPATCDLPSAEEIEPWAEAIVRLWDDEAFYRQMSHSAREEAEHWLPQKIAPLYRDFFSNIFRQPGPPLVPQVDKLQELCRGIGEGGES
jgi:glycosyltransferase involved in cell wall biosynthesis